MDAATFWVFIIAITLLTVSPGVDTVLVIRNATRGGLPDGLLTTLAICTGLFVHATVSAVGISVILLQSAFLFGLMKLAGAAYLVWLGAVSLRQAFAGGGNLEPGGSEARTFAPVRSIREGLLSNVLNPKPIVFYMAFLPQFIDPTGSALEQSLWLAFIHFVISVAWLSLVAAAVDRLRVWLTRGSVKRAFDATVGSALAGFGAVLAWEAVRRDP